jgi:glycosyltransferase involved in cell wall biosynthesis
VIPTHGGPYVAAAVSSVVAQTVKNWELIVVDDGSRDGTGNLVAPFAAADSRIRAVVNAHRTGIVPARNRGLASISPASEYVAFLDHDDVWMANSLEVLLGELSVWPEACAAHGRAIKIDGNGIQCPDDRASVPVHRMGLSEGRLVAWPDERPTEFANLVVEDCIVSLGSGLIRRSAIERIGGFDLRAERAEDYDLWIRLSRIGPIAFARKDVLAHRQHQGQTSRRPRPPRGSGLGYVRYKMIASAENTPEQRRLAIAGFRARQRQLLAQQWVDLRRAWLQHDPTIVPRHLVDGAARLAAYARGRPWSWHR